MMMKFNYNDEINLKYYAVKDPIITNNNCECIKTNQDEIAMYFENLGMFENLNDCVRFVEKQNKNLIFKILNMESKQQLKGTIKLYFY